MCTVDTNVISSRDALRVRDRISCHSRPSPPDISGWTQLLLLLLLTCRSLLLDSTTYHTSTTSLVVSWLPFLATIVTCPDHYVPESRSEFFCDCVYELGTTHPFSPIESRSLSLLCSDLLSCATSVSL